MLLRASLCVSTSVHIVLPTPAEQEPPVTAEEEREERGENRNPNTRAGKEGKKKARKDGASVGKRGEEERGWKRKEGRQTLERKDKEAENRINRGEAMGKSKRCGQKMCESKACESKPCAYPPLAEFSRTLEVRVTGERGDTSGFARNLGNNLRSGTDGAAAARVSWVII